MKSTIKWLMAGMSLAPLVVGLTAAQQTRPAPVTNDSSTLANVESDDYEPNPFKRCFFRDWPGQTGLFTRCRGYPDADRSEWPRDPVKYARWLSTLRFGGSTQPTYVTPEDSSSQPPVFVLERINDARAIALSQLGDDARAGLVVARILADPKGPRDKRYGIGAPRDTSLRLRRAFYLVVDRFIKSGRRRNEETVVSRWHVYGIDTSGGRDSVVELSTSGSRDFTRCDMKHTTEAAKDGAAFLPCNMARVLMEAQERDSVKQILQGEPIYDLIDLERAVSNNLVPSALRPRAARATTTLDRLLDVLGEPARSVVQTLRAQRVTAYPAWMWCGLGCCSAEM